MGTEPTDTTSGSRQPKLFESLARLFGPFLALFGSTALVSAFLVFAGFLSDFGAYRLAGLPRLNMTLTALAEQGADALIDSFSLLAGGLRSYVLAVGLLLVVTFWGWHDSPRLKPWARSVPLYRFARIALLIMALLLTGGLVERAQRSLSGAHYTPQAVEEALATAYAGAEFPTPYQRELAIERQTYELRVFGLANWGARLDVQWRNLVHRIGLADTAIDQQANPTGIELRQLPEARAAARHVFGWLALTVLALCTGIVLLGWWGQWLGQDEADEPPAAPPSPPLPALGPVPPPPPRRRRAIVLTLLGRGIRLLGGRADQPLERLLAPLTLLLAVVSMGLLPLAHGLLARESLGAETVMAYLGDGAPEAKEILETKVVEKGKVEGPATHRVEQAQQSPPDSALPGPTARLDCGADLASTMEGKLDSYREAQRDFLQVRPTESEFPAARRALGMNIEALAQAAIKADCADTIGLLWGVRPPVGMRALYPDIAETYQRSFRRVQAAYGVRVGTLLGYPRDTQGLTLAETIVPLPLPRGGQAAVIELPRATVAESIVIPDFERRRLLDIKRKVTIDPDSGEKKDLFFAASGEALEITTELLDGQKLHANAAGVAVTTIGTMANIASVERPAAATHAIDRLADLARAQPTPFWPEKSDEIRNTAVSALHLARSPYAAHRFIEAMRAEPVPAAGCPDPASGQLSPLPCLRTVPTAAGFVFQDLVTEIQNFRSRPPPERLLRDRDDLAALLVDIIVRPDTRDDVRGAACSALSFGGKFEANEAVRDRYWKYLQGVSWDTLWFSGPSCITQATVLGLDREKLRPWLRDAARGTLFTNVQSSMRLHLRRAALIALADLSLAQEAQLLFDLYTGNGAGANSMRDLTARVFKESAAEPLARLLLTCSGDGHRTPAERTRCLQGFQHLDKDYDGDHGPARAIHDAIATGQSHDTGESCKVLKVLVDRGSGWIRLLPPDDPVRTQCDLAHG